MTYNRFPPKTLVDVDGVPHIFVGHLAGRLHLSHLITGELFRMELPDGSKELPTDAHFEEMLGEGRIVLRSMRRVDDDIGLDGGPEWTADDAARIDPKTERMARICQMLDEANVRNGDKAIREFLGAHWTPELIEKYGAYDKPRTIRHWRTNRGSFRQRHPREMLRWPAGRNAAEKAIGIVAQVLWMQVLTGMKEGYKPKDIHAKFCAEIARINQDRHPVFPAPQKPLKPTGEHTTRRYINKLDRDDTLPIAIEKQAREQDWLGAGKSLTAEFAMQRVIIDHTPLDVHVVDLDQEMVLGRPWLTLAVDVKSRAIVGYVITFNDPSNWTVGEIMWRIAMPKKVPPEFAKRYPILRSIRGKPHELILDNAVEFRSYMMEAAARHTGIAVRFCPVKQPRYRAMGERGMGTINDQIVAGMKGRAMSPDEARRLNFDAEKEAVVMMDELEAVASYVIATYNVEPHGGLGELQPALVFERDMKRRGIDNFVDLESFRRDLMDISQGAQLTPSGIRAFNGLRYHDIRAVPELLNDLVALEPRRERRDDATATVDYRYDPMDIRHIHVWNRATRKYVTLKCADERYSAGMPLWLHQRILDQAKADGAAFNTEQERLVMRARCVEAIRNISPAAKLEARKRVAELLEIPRLRQIFGNLHHLIDVEPEPVAVGDFIANDRAAETCLDHEILSKRPASGSGSKTRDSRRRQKDAVDSQKGLDAAKATPRRRGLKGGYA